MNRNRFLKNRLKFISAIATGAMIMSSVLPYPALAVDSNLYEVTENGERETIVTYESAAYFAVTIPKKITLDGKTKSAGYSITVRGDIPSDAKVGVSPKDQIPGIEGVNFYMQEQAITRKADVVATVVQEATEWASNEVTETGTAKNGSISAPDLTAGKWQGAFMFDINLIENSESHTHNYVDGVCTGCGEKDPNAEVHTHAYAENITKEATCKEAGEKTLTCECGDTRTESISMKEHNYVDGICTECNGLDTEYMPIINELEDGSEYGVGKILTIKNNETLKVNGATVPLTDNTFTFDTEGQYTVTVTAPNGNEFTITITIVHTHNYEDGFCTTCGEADKAVFSEAGLYTATGKQLATWAELTEDYGMDIVSNSTSSSSKTASILQGTTVNPNNSNYVLVIKDGITSIGDYAFNDCNKLKTIVVPNSVTSIGKYAFNNCTSLVDIPNNVASIGDGAFSGCTGLTSIVISDSVTSIGDWVFNNCTRLTNVTISGDVTCTGTRGVFGYNTSIVNVNILNNVTSIGNSLFYNCAGLTSIIIPDSVTSIGNGAFYNCTGLTNIVIPDSVTSIGNGAFQSCTGLTNIVIPDSVTNINDYTFEKCTKLTDVTLSNNTTSIGNGAFKGCTSLTNIIIPDSVTSIEKFAFSNCTKLTNVVIPDEVTNIGNYAFDGVPHITYNGTATGSPWGAKSIN